MPWGLNNHLNAAEDRISKQNNGSEEITQNSAQRPGDRKYAKEVKGCGGQRIRWSNVYLMRASKRETK